MQRVFGEAFAQGRDGKTNKARPFPQIHHAVHLLATALATNRTLILYNENWRYGNTEADNEAYAEATVRGEPPPRKPAITATGTHSEGLWSSLFQPATHCATPGEQWVGSLSPLLPSTAADVASERAVVAGLVAGAPFDWDPPSVPPDVFRLAAPFHARPEVWYAGVLAAWLMRPAGERDAARGEWAASVGLSERNAPRPQQQAASPPPVYKPYIGVHVRRTDKIVSLMDVSTGQQTTPEAAGIALDDYFAAAEAAWRAGRAAADPTTPWPLHPTIYLATDDDTVLEEAKRGHPHIRFVSHPVGASTARAFATRAPPPPRPWALSMTFISSPTPCSWWARFPPKSPASRTNWPKWWGHQHVARLPTPRSPRTLWMPPGTRGVAPASGFVLPPPLPVAACAWMKATPCCATRRLGRPLLRATAASPAAPSCRGRTWWCRRA